MIIIIFINNISTFKLKVLQLLHFKPIYVIIFHDFKKFVLKKISHLYAFSGYFL